MFLHDTSDVFTCRALNKGLGCFSRVKTQTLTFVGLIKQLKIAHESGAQSQFPMSEINKQKRVEIRIVATTLQNKTVEEMRLEI